MGGASVCLVVSDSLELLKLVERLDTCKNEEKIMKVERGRELVRVPCYLLHLSFELHQKCCF